MNFALQGYISFSYDMLGYNDSVQVAHHWGKSHHASWGLTPQGLRLNLWGASILGLQLWNSIRALDVVLSLPDVDADRILATGATGGTTQILLVLRQNPVRSSFESQAAFQSW
jgi:cephalosporin-C deacetylase-like acetyl esterase